MRIVSNAAGIATNARDIEAVESVNMDQQMQIKNNFWFNVANYARTDQLHEHMHEQDGQVVKYLQGQDEKLHQEMHREVEYAKALSSWTDAQHSYQIRTNAYVAYDAWNRADRAQGTADWASWKADRAQWSAYNAQHTANWASWKADNAQNTANWASWKADQAQWTANFASYKADRAQDTANNAMWTATSAYYKADSAQRFATFNYNTNWYQQQDINTNNAKVGITQQQSDAIITNLAKTGITADQAESIFLNSAKIGITTQQADAIALSVTRIGNVEGMLEVGGAQLAANTEAIAINTAKVGMTAQQSAALVSAIASTGITAEQAEAIALNSAKVGITAEQVAAIESNAAAVTDMSRFSAAVNSRVFWGKSSGKCTTPIATLAECQVAASFDSTQQVTAMTRNTYTEVGGDYWCGRGYQMYWSSSYGRNYLTYDRGGSNYNRRCTETQAHPVAAGCTRQNGRYYFNNGNSDRTCGEADTECVCAVNGL